MKTIKLRQVPSTKFFFTDYIILNCTQNKILMHKYFLITHGTKILLFLLCIPIRMA